MLGALHSPMSSCIPLILKCAPEHFPIHMAFAILPGMCMEYCIIHAAIPILKYRDVPIMLCNPNDSSYLYGIVLGALHDPNGTSNPYWRMCLGQSAIQTTVPILTAIWWEHWAIQMAIKFLLEYAWRIVQSNGSFKINSSWICLELAHSKQRFPILLAKYLEHWAIQTTVLILPGMCSDHCTIQTTFPIIIRVCLEHCVHKDTILLTIKISWVETHRNCALYICRFGMSHVLSVVCNSS